MSSSHSSKESSSNEDYFSKERLDGYKADHLSKESCAVEVLKPVSTYFTMEMNIATHLILLQSQIYNWYISRKIAKGAKYTDLQLKSSTFKWSGTISILAFVHNFKTACDSIWFHEGTAMRLFPRYMKEPTKAAILYWMRAAEDRITREEGTLTDYCQFSAIYWRTAKQMMSLQKLTATLWTARCLKIFPQFVT